MSALGTRPATSVLGTAVKRLLIGRPISTHAELHQRINKRIGLAVFSSDALSSSAYATDEILLALALAGTVALGLSVPIAIGVVSVLLVVVTSYRHTIRAYPGGGGAFLVAHENLGQTPGLIAASALLVDYVLTVSVSVAAGVAAVGAAFPQLRDDSVAIALAVVTFITLANLRGVKESGMLFSVPTFGFLITVGAMILYGGYQVATGNVQPLPPPDIEPERALTLFLILRAFASGSTALTGIEAIADGVPAFKPPESKNASQTLLVLGILLSFLFLGITILANAYRVNPAGIELGETVPSQIATGVFGAGTLAFYVVQFFTALILFLAANTSYADFPRLSSILARERYLPRVLKNRGDKLAFSNGIILLAVAAGAVLVNYRADVHRVIPLYVVGVFTSFTLSQLGMVVRWRRLRRPGWRRPATINAVGATTTFIVLIVVATTKFTLGAWQVIILIPTIAWLLYHVRRHYSKVEEELRRGPSRDRIVANKFVVLASPIPGANLKAVSFAKAVDPAELHVLAFRVPESRLREVRKRWEKLGIKIPIEATGHRLGDLVDFVRGLDPSPTRPVSLVVPDPQYRNPVVQILRGILLLRIKRVFLAEPDVIVISVPFQPDREPEPQRLRSPNRLAIMVLVAGVHNATIRALDYARSLKPSELKAITIATDPADTSRVLHEWTEAHLEVPLELVDSPYRSVIQPVLKEVRSLGPSPDDAVAVLLPEFVVARWWQHFLHGQTAFLIKTALLFEPNVVVIDVPYPIAGRDRAKVPAY